MRFFRELKRRKVLHTASLYVVAAWIALQVVEVLSDAGLPPATMRHVLIALSVGFPFMLIAAWFYDISTEGFRRTAPLAADEQLPKLNLRDRALVAGLFIVVALNFYVLSSPPIETRCRAPLLNSVRSLCWLLTTSTWALATIQSATPLLVNCAAN